MGRFLIAILALYFLSCKSTFNGSFVKKIRKSEVFNQNFTGFSLFDFTENKTVINFNEAQYFQPASNMKLLTFYAGLKTLGDSIPAIKYIKRGDSLIFWGTGDPSLLHPDLPASNVLNFLKNRPEKLYFSNSNNFQSMYGSGWAWDDFNDDYQVEINSFPIYGNMVRFTMGVNKLSISPQKATEFSSKKNNSKRIIRETNSNIFSLPNDSLNLNFKQDVPFKTSPTVTSELLIDALKRQVFHINIPLQKDFKTIYSIKSDSLYKRMLHVSDNMIAEQIMLLVSKADTLNISKSIDYITKTYLSDLPDKPRWVDGSGLSRYNLITPRTIVKVLEKLYKEVPQQRLFGLLATGGRTGNLKNSFQADVPFIFAKSGSYSNNYNLSGYLIGNSGKTYAFSFMNNNFLKPMAQIRKEVERILTELRDKL